MRINEKALSHIATSKSVETDCSGVLVMHNIPKREAKQRFFTLKGNLLFYFDEETSAKLKGVIILEGHRVEDSDEIQPFGFCLYFPACKDVIYHLSASSNEVRRQWTDKLRNADYQLLLNQEALHNQQTQELMRDRMKKRAFDVHRTDHSVADVYDCISYLSFDDQHELIRRQIVDIISASPPLSSDPSESEANTSSA